MNAALVHDFNASPRYATFADPVPTEGERLVTVTAAGLHRVVRSLANGTHYGSTAALPFIPGVDGVGRLDDGTCVFFAATRSPFGTFAERTVTAASTFIPIPDGLDDATVAGLANPGMSSWAALQVRAGFVAGESVLILGATGTSGKLAVQIAKRLGARHIIVAGRNPQALEELRSLGADTIISLTQPHEALVAAFRSAIAANGVNVVLDYLWGQPAESLLEAIAHKGLSHIAPRIRYVQVGSTAGANISLPAATLRSTGLELLGSGFGSASIQQILQSVTGLLQEAARQPFQTSIRTAPLHEIEALWNAPDSGDRLVFQP